MMQSGNRAANESEVTSLSNEHALDFDDDTLIGQEKKKGKKIFFLRDRASNTEWARYGPSILAARVANQTTGFTSLQN